MCFIVNTYMYLLGTRRTYATSRLLSFSTPSHPECSCFLHSLPHMQHRVQCELARRPKIARRRSDGCPNLFGQFLEEAPVEDCQVPHEHNFMHHVGSCLALLSLQSTGNTNVSIRDAPEVGEPNVWRPISYLCPSPKISPGRSMRQDRTLSRVQQEAAATPHLHCHAIARTLPSQALATRSDRSASGS